MDRRTATLSRRLCLAALAAPLANVVGLAVAIRAGQCVYPHFTISDVIRTSPGLNVVAAGWTIFAACFSLVSHLQREILSVAALRISELHGWLFIRDFVNGALIVLMSTIHLVPLQSPSSTPSAPWLGVHFTVAGLYATFGVLEAWLLVQRIEPLLRRHALLKSRDGRWLRRLILYISPLWAVVAGLGAVGMAIHDERLEFCAAVLEFAIITIYGMYPISLIAFVRDLDGCLREEASTSLPSQPAPGAARNRQAGRSRSPPRRRCNTTTPWVPRSPLQAETI